MFAPLRSYPAQARGRGRVASRTPWALPATRLDSVSLAEDRRRRRSGRRLRFRDFALAPRRDPKLSSDATAAALQKELHTPYGFSCTPEEDDVTIELGDVDFACEADRVSQEGYWVGTDGSKITGMQSMG